MYYPNFHRNLNDALQTSGLDLAGVDNPFFVRSAANLGTIYSLLSEVYPDSQKNSEIFKDITNLIIEAYQQRPAAMKLTSQRPTRNIGLNNNITGMSLYVDRFCNKISNLSLY